MTNEIVTIEKEMQQEVSAIIQQAQGIVIADSDTYTQAADLFSTAKKMQKEIEAFFKPLKQAQDAAKKKLLDAEKAELAKIQPAIDILASSMKKWIEEQERIRLEEEKRLAEIARQMEEDRRIAEAAELESQGDNELAEAIISEPINIPAPAPLTPKPKAAGVAMRSSWSAEVTSLIALIKAVAEGKAPLQCIQADMTFLNNQARAGKGTISYPGVVIREERNVVGARR